MYAILSNDGIRNPSVVQIASNLLHKNKEDIKYLWLLSGEETKEVDYAEVFDIADVRAVNITLNWPNQIKSLDYMDMYDVIYITAAGDTREFVKHLFATGIVDKLKSFKGVLMFAGNGVDITNRRVPDGIGLFPETINRNSTVGYAWEVVERGSTVWLRSDQIILVVDDRMTVQSTIISPEEGDAYYDS